MDTFALLSCLQPIEIADMHDKSTEDQTSNRRSDSIKNRKRQNSVNRQEPISYIRTTQTMTPTQTSLARATHFLNWVISLMMSPSGHTPLLIVFFLSLLFFVGLIVSSFKMVFSAFLGMFCSAAAKQGFAKTSHK